LNHLNIILAIESEFGVELSPEDAFNMGSVALIRAVLRGHGVEV
jgi:acyl carrier protein